MSRYAHWLALATALMAGPALAAGVTPAPFPGVGTTTSTVARGDVDPLARSAVQQGGDVSTNIATGRTLAARVADVINVMDAPYGAKCDVSYPTLSLTANSNTATVTGGGVNLAQGQQVFGGGIAAHSTISAVVGNQVTLSLPATGTTTTTAVAGTEDSTAINAAFTKARAVQASANTQPVQIVSPRAQRCLVFTSVQATGLGYGAKVDLSLECSTSGVTCLDGAGSGGVEWNGVLVGAAYQESWSAFNLVQTGSYNVGHNIINHMIASGYWSHAAHYNFNTSNVTYNEAYFYNSDTGNASFGCIFDGYNHFGVTSTSLTLSAAADTRGAFDALNMNGGACVSHSTQPLSAGMWAGGLNAPEFHGTYVGALNGPTQGVILYNEDVLGSPNGIWDLHMEDYVTMTACFLISGPYATPIINGFTWRDEGADCTATDIKADTNITSVTINDAHIDLTTNYPTAVVPMFDQPGIYNVSGDITLPNIGSWNQPVSFSGKFCYASRSGIGGCIPYVPTEAINQNPDLTIDQTHAANTFTSSTLINSRTIDGWKLSGGVSGAVVAMTQSTLAPAGYGNSFQSKITTAGSVGASQVYRLESTLEGPDAAPWQWGTTSAQAITVTFWDYRSTAGQYSIYFRNAAGTRSLIQPYTVAAANTWQKFSFQIPGETSGVWASTPGTVGLYFGFGEGVGSNFQTAGTGWQAGSYYGSTTDSQFATLANSQWNLGPVHLIAGQFNLPAKPRPFTAELERAKRFYQKSCDYTVYCRSVAALGALGAPTFRAPYTAATFASADVFVPLRPAMAADPTLTFFSTATSTGNCYDAALAADAGAAIGVNIGVAGFAMQCALSASGAIGDQLQAQWIADSGF